MEDKRFVQNYSLHSNELEGGAKTRRAPHLREWGVIPIPGRTDALFVRKLQPEYCLIPLAAGSGISRLRHNFLDVWPLTSNQKPLLLSSSNLQQDSTSQVNFCHAHAHRSLGD